MQTTLSLLSSATLVVGLAVCVTVTLPWSIPVVWLGWKIWQSS